MENKFLEAMNFRHACKSFDPSKKISEEEFFDILEIGRMSPSSFGMEPWKFVVIQNKELREKLKLFTAGGQGQLPTASHFVIILSRKKQDLHYSSEYIDNRLRYRELPEDVIAFYHEFYERFQKEDFKLLGDDKYIFDWGTKQTYIALANMMTGAASMGIDSCPIEGFELEATETFLREELCIDTNEFGPAVMVAFGYRVDEPKAKSRFDMGDVVTWYN
ncbi:MAG: Oxygen-insensitive NAD(P)H nitroreductase (EC / Dihydropteridine reductase (EC [uncultured Sulfurovum sp.]|uniref:Oxygen-insensitive NAD(P)H nitroreductase ) n=1 Tax=uncultured Sulfurovum sp. TaxID=269237 RepID=A0A6S6RV75_9BACT|nr:MAG: Oxygen-insensitive NAD(P)H nitroreductase (EC / Dihydropteridine reductase (EC [uncultured Sulfurovum sp.]